MIANLETLRRQVADAVDDRVRADLERAVLDGRAQRGHHAELALLCEQAGLMHLAFSEFQLALRDDPQDAVAAFHLAQHYGERGDVDRALGLLERLLAARPAQPDWLASYIEILVGERAEPRARAALDRAVKAGLDNTAATQLASLLRAAPREPEPPQPGAAPQDEAIPLPSDADCVRFHTLFSGREGVYARQWAKRGGEGGYSPVHEPLTPAVIRNHLLGTYTLGVYPLRLDATATFFAIDLDIDKMALQRARGDHPFAQSLRQALQQEGPRLVQVLRDLGFDPLLENSGYKGRHLWVFLQQPETAATLHLLGRLLLASQVPLLPPYLHLEFFPKQARLKGKGLGNLIKLPLGIHRRTGRRSLLLDAAGQPVPDPYAMLRDMPRTPQAAVHAAVARLKSQVPPGSPPAADDLDEPADAEIADSPTPRPKAARPVTLPDALPVWTEADFETDPRVRHMLQHCPVLAELKRMVDEYRQLSHEEQLVLIHSLGYVDAGPQAVNYLLGKCVDVGPEKFMKARLKGNPVSCPSIRKKIPHVTRRLACNCAFEYAADRYPTPTLHMLTAKDELPPQPAPTTAGTLRERAQRFAVLDCRRKELEREWSELRDALVERLRNEPDRQVACREGRYRLLQVEGVEELVWEE